VSATSNNISVRTNSWRLYDSRLVHYAILTTWSSWFFKVDNICAFLL